MMKVLKRMLCFVGVLTLVWFWNADVAMAEQSPVEVAPLTDVELETIVYGTRVVVKEGTEYYASAYGFGSGPHGTIGNRYTKLGTNIYVGGFALLNEDGELVAYKGYNPKDVPVSTTWQTDVTDASWDLVWAEIFLDPNHDSPIAWIPARSIVVINGIVGDGGSNECFSGGVRVVPKDDDFDISEIDELQPEIIDTVLPDPGNMIEDRVIANQDMPDDTSDEDAFISTREIAYAIEDYAESGGRVALLLDASGSVADYMSEIADYGKYVDKVNRAETIIVFAKWFEVIAVEDYFDTNVGGTTDIYAPLNSLDVTNYDRIIIATDTWHNEFTYLKQQSDFIGKIVVVCPDEEYDFISTSVIEDMEKAYGTTVYLCRLDNELDRARALEVLEQ